MKLAKPQKITLFATLMLCAAIVAWAIFQFNEDDQTAGAILAGIGAISGCSLGFYLKSFFKKKKD